MDVRDRIPIYRRRIMKLQSEAKNITTSEVIANHLRALAIKNYVQYDDEKLIDKYREKPDDRSILKPNSVQLSTTRKN